MKDLSKSILVIVARGKIDGQADYITALAFDTVEEAKKFCVTETDLESKYWTRAEIVKLGEKIEPRYEEYYK